MKSITLFLSAFILLTQLVLCEEETVFFAFDDQNIPWRHNLKVTLVKADKHPDNPVVRRDPKGAPDHGHAILYGTVFKDGDHTMIWYSHWDTGGKLKSMEIGLATLRRDGFGYLSRQQLDSDAEFISSFFTLNVKSNISINVSNVSPELALEIDLLDHLAQPIPGFHGKNAARIRTNGTRVAVNWSKPLPADKKLALRVRYPGDSLAKVYALYFTQ